MSGGILRFICTNLQNMVDYTIIRRNPELSGSVFKHGEIMIYLLWSCMVLIPYLCGRGFLNILYKNPEKREYTGTDFLLTGVLISVGITEAAHLYGVYGGASVTRSMRLMGVCFILAAVLSVFICVRRSFLNRKLPVYQDSVSQRGYAGQTAVYIGFAAVIVFVIEFIMIQVSDNIYLDGDMTVETVNTFIETDAFYSVNPLTGAAYTQGLPSRLKILCLPSLYTFFVKTFHMSSAVVVWRAVPAFVFICSVAAYKNLADTIFFIGDTKGKDKEIDYKKRNMFLLFVAAIFLIGDYMYGVDGFLALESGFRGVAVRGLVLIPYTISLTLRKKWIPVILCIIAEACITWTFYGAGVCLFIAFGLIVTEYFYKRIRAGKEEA